MCLSVLVRSYYWYATTFGHCINVNVIYPNRFIWKTFELFWQVSCGLEEKKLLNITVQRSKGSESAKELGEAEDWSC